MTEPHRNATSLYAIKGGQIGNNILTELLRGLSSYNLWIELGNEGTEEDYLEWLRGPQGIPGIGIQGIQGPPGPEGSVASDPGSSFVIYAQKYAPSSSGHLTIGATDGDPNAVFVAPVGFHMDCLTFATSAEAGLTYDMTVKVWVNGVMRHGSVIASGTGKTTIVDDGIDVAVSAGDTINLTYTCGGVNSSLTITTAIHCSSGRGGGFFDLRCAQAQWSDNGFWMSWGDRNAYGREGMPAPMNYQLDTITLGFDRAPDYDTGTLEVYIDGAVVATANVSNTTEQTLGPFGLDVSKGDRIGFKVIGDLDGLGGTLNCKLLASCFDANGDGGVSQHMVVGSNKDMDNGEAYGHLGAYVVPKDCTMTAVGMGFYESVSVTEHILYYSLNGGTSTELMTLPIGYQGLSSTGLSLALSAGDIIEFTHTGGDSGTTGTASVVFEYAATGVVDYPKVPLITSGTTGYAITVNATEDAYELTGPYSDGADGLDGATGPAGADGLDGATGPAGPAGADGVDGVLSGTVAEFNTALSDGDFATLSGVEDLTFKTLSRPYIIHGVDWSTSTARTLVITDIAKKIFMVSASPNTVTIPTNASVPFLAGSIIGITTYGAGTTSIVADTGVYVNGVLAGATTILNQYSGVTLTYVGTDTWVLEGNHGVIS